jgi:hypothetical protein
MGLHEEAIKRAIHVCVFLWCCSFKANTTQLLARSQERCPDETDEFIQFVGTAIIQLNIVKRQYQMVCADEHRCGSHSVELALFHRPARSVVGICTLPARMHARRRRRRQSIDVWLAGSQTMDGYDPWPSQEEKRPTFGVCGRRQRVTEGSRRRRRRRQQVLKVGGGNKTILRHRKARNLLSGVLAAAATQTL